MLRTHTCGELNSNDIGKNVVLFGWVNKNRNLGGLNFVDLRDRYGITQITVDPEKFDFVGNIKNEFVLKIEGEVISRPDDMKNINMSTGEIEIKPKNIEIISKSDELPFTVDNELGVGEEIRLEYRYLDLRRGGMKNKMLKRSQAYLETMNFFANKGFLYFETPSFVKNTPEGSREYVVPARFDPGKFFVLPQSPQQHKQMLMVAGFDKYFQLPRCFRDEDPRGDRQPEFTQVDIEMSFVSEEDILNISKEYVLNIAKKLYPERKIVDENIPMITWFDAMDKYGSDKPELRTKQLSFVDATNWGKNTDFGIFQEAECIKAVVVNKLYGRSEIEKNLEPVIKENGGKGLAYIILDPEGTRGSIAKFFSNEQIENLKSISNAKSGDTIFFQASSRIECVELMGALRTKLIKDLDLLNGMENDLYFEIVSEFPMFELNSQGDITSVHHPFTKPKDEYIPYIIELAKNIENGYNINDDDKKKLVEIKADQSDIILNGVELGGGGMRIHDKLLKHSIFSILGLDENSINERFGHLLKCFKYGVPPHGGTALGFDRFLMQLEKESNIREVMCFPKNQKYRDPMLNSPSEIDDSLLDELGLKLK